MIMPSIIESGNRMSNFEVFAAVQQLESSEAQVAALNRLDLAARTWNPMTLLGGGLFHLAFGAVLTGAAVTRGFEKKAAIENEHHFK